MHRRTLASLVAASLLALSTTAVSANDVPLHQHYLTTPSGKTVDFARGICRNDLQTAMNNLHRNVHVGSAGAAWAANGFTLIIEFC